MDGMRTCTNNQRIFAAFRHRSRAPTATNTTPPSSRSASLPLLGAETFSCRDVAILPRQAAKIWFVPEHAVICFGNMECHHAVRYVGPSNSAVEPAKFVRHQHNTIKSATETPPRLKSDGTDAALVG